MIYWDNIGVIYWDIVGRIYGEYWDNLTGAERRQWMGMGEWDYYE